MSDVAQSIAGFLKGTIGGDVSKYGQTTAEERVQSQAPAWPHLHIDVPVRNQDLKVYGGSQYDRLMAEFETVCHAMEFPKVSGVTARSSLYEGGIKERMVRRTIAPLVVNYSCLLFQSS
jgi:hypothetical protein